MRLKTLLAATTLALLPSLSLALCSGDGKADQQAMSCSEGTQWDQTTGTCVPLTNT